ncbi:MAG: Eco57I restriction-modification methylase domain-containing protein [Dermatophilaceae bacterium]
MRARRRGAPSVADLHRAWLQLVDTEGPFLAVPPLKRVWPQGIPPLADDAKATLVEAKPAFDQAWDTWDRNRDNEGTRAAYRAARDAWVDVVLRQVFGWGDLLTGPGAVTAAARVVSPDHTVSAEPTAAMVHGELVGALVWVVDPVGSLRDVVGDSWASTPIDRMAEMLRRSETTIGLVTDGRWWALVSAAPKTMTASGIVDAQTWVEEPATRNAFAALLRPQRLVGGAERDRLPVLFAESVLAAEQVTEALGVQVRKAVELVVSAFSEGAADAGRRGDPDPLPADRHTVYEAVVTVLMRVVFLLFAEERGLLPQGQLFASGYGLAGVLDDLDERARHEGEEALDATHLTWHRLLATSQALYEGATFEDMRLPAYGGSLFDPGRFPFLTAVTARGTLALQVSDRVLLHVLRAVQVARPKGQDARRISFRDIDVEQIGYIYEGLLGYTCRVADEVVVGLLGSHGMEPEIPLDTLEAMAERYHRDAELAGAVLAWCKAEQPASKPPTVAALAKALRAGDTMADAERALIGVTRDEVLRKRLRPWVGVIRRDLRDRPVVVAPGGLLVAETPSRRNAGAHYTPRELAEEVVLHALEPLVYRPGPHQSADRDTWRPVSSDELLDLKVADIACGSGAFLVAAARYLAARLVEAWGREGTVTLPPHELEVAALRKVVATCLYGADINGMAVEMCKLSLWLVSLDPDLPFAFVDDKVLHGNSLLGVTSLRQLEELHIAPKPMPAQRRFEIGAANQFVEPLDIDHVVARAIALRRSLAMEISEVDPQRTATAKRRQLAELARVTADLARVADGVVAAGLALGGKPGRALDEAYANLKAAVGQAFPRSGQGNPAMLDAIIAKGLTPTVPTDYDRWQPLHWALAVPDVMELGGFDAIIGNPPFLGGQKLTGALGTNMRDWFVNALAGGTRGSADLVAYFFLRALALLGAQGNLGLIATNTVAQGDTREVGLDRMLDAGFTITRAIQSRSWPGLTTNLEFAAVWGTRDRVAKGVPRVADDVEAARITTLLEPGGRVEGHPVRLVENAGIAFQGCIVLGKGFIIDPDEAQDWIDADRRNAEVLFPYLNGEDLNSRPDCSASRWVIDFNDHTEIRAAEFKGPFARVLQRVKPERAGKPKAVRDAPWWLFLRTRPALRKAIAGLDDVLVIARVSKTVMPWRIPTGLVCSDATVVLASESFGDQAVLSSSVHQLWAITYGSGMRNDPRYTPSDVFDTFPRPEPTDDLERLSRVLDEERREMMLRRQLGLTKLYNLVNDPEVRDTDDPDVARLRAIHVELDNAVMAAYGWGDVPLDHGFHTYRQMRRWTVSPAARVEILDRLLEENHRRAARQGAPPPADDEDATEPDDGGDER